MRLFTGGYTADMDGAADGIGMLLAGAADDVLAGGPLGYRGTVAPLAGSPSWLTAHPTLDVVYAALEGAGRVQALRRTGEHTFARLGAPVEAGALVCHVAIAPDGGSLLASCWGDGRVVRMRLDAAGTPSAPQIAAAADDPYASSGMRRDEPADLDLAAAARALREAAGAEYAHLIPEVPDAAETPAAASERVSRAHQAFFLPDGTTVTTDMGFDLVRFWRRDGVTPRGRVVLPRGTGPRHLVRHPSGYLYVVTEISCEVYVLGADDSGAWRVVGSAPISPATVDGDLAAELQLTRDGAFLLVGVRGSDTLATLRVAGSGERLVPVALVDAGVEGPRHHLVERDTVLVAGQLSHGVASLTLDLRTGVPGRVRHRASVPSPTVLLADR